MQTADLITEKVLRNRNISTPGGYYMCINFKNFYLETPLDWYEYICIK